MAPSFIDRSVTI